MLVKKKKGGEKKERSALGVWEGGREGDMIWWKRSLKAEES